MKTQKANNQKKSQKASPLFHCEDFQKMAEMMKTCCPGEGDIIDCSSIMGRTMGQGKEAKETQKPSKG